MVAKSPSKMTSCPRGLENPAGLGQRPLRVEQMRVDRVRNDEVKAGVWLPGGPSLADRE